MTVIYFDIRADTDERLEHVAARVGQALECTFAEGEYARWYAQIAYAFGLKLVLSGVGGIGGKHVAKLESKLAERGLEPGPVGGGRPDPYLDISSYITDLLTLRTGLQWYQPTAEDRAAENKASAAFDDFLGGVGTEPWSRDDEERFIDRLKAKDRRRGQ